MEQPREIIVTLAEEKLLRRLRQLRNVFPEKIILLHLSPLVLQVIGNEEILEAIDKEQKNT